MSSGGFLLAWIKANPADAVRAAVASFVALFAAGAAWASLDARIATLEKAAPGLAEDVRVTRDMVRFICSVTPGCPDASRIP
jgi:hypothetical protein